MLRSLVYALGLSIALVAAAQAQSTSDIRFVQRALTSYGVTKIDGAQGPETRKAIRAYQRDWQLSITGEITSELLAMLRRDHSRTRPQWIDVVNMKCRIWNQRPQPRETAFWTGTCENGRTSGTGKLVWSFMRNGEWKQSTYNGERRNGEEHGRGLWIDHSGALYEGEWKKGQRHGRGVLVGADGDRYEGEWRNGRQEGNGTISLTSGRGYKGQWRAGKPHGRGALILANSTRESRLWNNGCSVGDGVLKRRALATSLRDCGFDQRPFN